MISTDALPPMQLYVVMAIVGTFAASVIASLRETDLKSSITGVSDSFVVLIMATILIAAWGHLMFSLAVLAKVSGSDTAHILFHAFVIAVMLPLALVLLIQAYIARFRKQWAQISSS